MGQFFAPVYFYQDALQETLRLNVQQHVILKGIRVAPAIMTANVIKNVVPHV